MSSTQTSLFQTTMLRDDEMLSMIEKQLRDKCKCFDVSFGTFKAKNGPVAFTALVNATGNNDQRIFTSVQGESMHDLLSKITDKLLTLNK